MLCWGTILSKAIMEDLIKVTPEQRLKRDAVMCHEDI